MAQFDDRKKSFEAKFAHDAETQFKVEARRNRLLGEWAGDKLGKSGDERAAYAKEVVKADFQEQGDEDVFRKVRGDLGSDVSDEEIRSRMTQLRDEAKRQVMEEMGE